MQLYLQLLQHMLTFETNLVIGDISGIENKSDKTDQLQRYYERFLCSVLNKANFSTLLQIDTVCKNNPLTILWL